MNDLTARIDEQLKATQGHTPASWTYELDSICHGYEYRDGKHVATWIATVDHENREDYADDGYHSSSPQADRDAALIASAPTLRALLIEARAQIAAQAEALASAGKADRLIREWFAEMVGIEKAEGEYRQDQTLGEALTQAHTRKLRAEIKLATYAAPSAAARFGLTESNADSLLGAHS